MTRLSLFLLGAMACSGKSSGAGKSAASAAATDPWAGSASAIGAMPAAARVDYKTLATTASGKALVGVLPDASTPADAIRRAVGGLDGFDARPSITGAYEDSSSRRGGATFTGTIGGQPVRGSVLYGAHGQGATVAITYARADAPADELAALVNAIPTDEPLEPHALPGGAGTISFPAGWSITNATATGSVEVDGPDGQRVEMNSWAEVVDPRSQSAQILQQSGQAWKFLMAPYSKPDQALVAIAPQIARQAQATGQMVETLGQILETQDLTPSIQGGYAQALYYSATQYRGGQPVPIRTRARVETFQVDPSQGGWMIAASMMTAPDAAFDRELPTLVAIAQSYKPDDARIAANTRGVIEAQNAWVAHFEDSMRANQAAVDSFEASSRNAVTMSEASSADFDEVVRGYRTIENTTTGQRSDVDLGNAGDIVQHLNEFNPDLYRELPLRNQ